MTDETHADAGTPRPLTLEWMEASRDHWMNKAIERKERLIVILAAARAVVEVEDRTRWTTLEEAKQFWRDHKEAIDALRAAVEAAGRERQE